MEAAGAGRGGPQRAKRRPQILRHLGDEAARAGAVGEREIGPEGAEHLGQMRLARAVEAGDPDGALIAPAERGQEQLKDAHQAAPVLAIGDEGLQFSAQGLADEPALGREDDFRNPLIGDAVFFGVGVENLAIQHGRQPLPGRLRACYGELA